MKTDCLMAQNKGNGPKTLKKEPLTQLKLKTENDWRHNPKGHQGHWPNLRASNSEPNS
jgi:hypothetical protein